MSKFDYRDPGTDPEYCNALSDEPDELDVLDEAEAAVNTACQLLRDAVLTQDTERLFAVWQRARKLEARIADVAREAAERNHKVAVFPEPATCFVSAEDHQTYWGV